MKKHKLSVEDALKRYIISEIMHLNFNEHTFPQDCRVFAQLSDLIKVSCFSYIYMNPY